MEEYNIDVYVLALTTESPIFCSMGRKLCNRHCIGINDVCKEGTAEDKGKNGNDRENHY